MRILVLGGAGMLGHKIVQRLTARGCDVWWTLHGPANDPALAGIPELTGDRAIPHFDATRPEAVRETFRAVRPAVVINCVGIVKQST
jgi:dTDP-4-dehydrorhamnose reductase